MALILLNQPKVKNEQSELQIEFFHHLPDFAKMDISFTLELRNDHINGLVEYATDLFHAENLRDDDAGSADAQHAGRRSERRRRADWPRPPRRQCKAMQGNARKLHKPTDADAGRSAHARARQRQQKIGPTPARRLVAAPRRQR